MAKDSIRVVDGKHASPFLRGMLTQSLVSRGMKFEDAFRIANQVRDRVRPRKSITKKKLQKLIREVVQEEFGKDIAHRLDHPSAIPTILVRGQDVLPFSKGILSRSLQASGLEPPQAYEIAQELEMELADKSQIEISRDGLRRMIYKAILSKYGRDYAERYLLWRLFKTPDRPLVIVLGGATGVGKTSIASEVAHRLDINKILSTDTVRQIMRTMFSRDLLPALHYSSFEAWKGYPSPSPGTKKQPVLPAFVDQVVRVLVGVQAMISRAIQENTNLIIEGVHLVPGLIDLSQFSREAYVVPIVVSTLDQAQHLERFPLRQKLASNRAANRYRRNFKHILEIQDFILELAEANDTPIVENVSLDRAVSHVLSLVTTNVRKQLKISSNQLIDKTL